MKAFALSYFMLVSVVTYPQTFDVLKQIAFSDGLGALGFVMLPSATAYGPSRLGFDAKGNVYIADSYNRSINIYNPDMNLAKYIDLSAFPDMSEARIINVFENGDILNASAYLIRSTPQGKEVYEIDPVQKGLTERFYYNRIWAIGNHVLFYANGKTPVLLDQKGNVLGKDEARTMILAWRYASAIYKGLKDPSALDGFLDANKLVLVGNRLYSEDTYLLDDYLQILYKQAIAEDAKRPFNLRDFRNETDFRGSGMFVYYGFDAHDNYYLDLHERDGPRWIVVLDPKGVLLAKISWPGLDLLRTTFYDVSPNGDIYTYVIDHRGKTFTFYLMKNTWDPMTLPQNVAAPAAGLISYLSASSMQTEPADKNAYHPVKLFDGDHKTMWIEGAKGPGFGENVAVSFAQPITADEIKFEPGCYWPEYWKQNNRVKSLDVKLDVKKYMASFKDEMTVQSLKLGSPVTFNAATFTIKDVYPTTKWEDTAISEIAFYNQGTKIDIDYSRYAQFLKKAP